jgi:hypothetical protein
LDKSALETSDSLYMTNKELSSMINWI